MFGLGVVAAAVDDAVQKVGAGSDVDVAQRKGSQGRHNVGPRHTGVLVGRTSRQSQATGLDIRDPVLNDFGKRCF